MVFSSLQSAPTLNSAFDFLSSTAEAENGRERELRDGCAFQGHTVKAENEIQIQASFPRHWSWEVWPHWSVSFFNILKD